MAIKQEPEFGFVRFLQLALGIVVAWVGSALLVAWLIPSWQDRSNFGDMFGAVNSLFSGLALAGVIYALLLQRGELALQRSELELSRESFRSQLAEMESSRQIQTQPLVIASGVSFSVERPRVFYTPPEDRYSAGANYTARISLSNPSGTPALGVCLHAHLCGAGDEPGLQTTNRFVAVLPSDGTSSIDRPNPSFSFVPESPKFLEAWLDRKKPWDFPQIGIQAYFRNLSGGHFRSRVHFRLAAQDAPSLRRLEHWKLHLDTFGQHLQAHLSALPGPGSRRSWREWFDDLQASYGSAVAKDPDEIELRAEIIHETFDISTVSAQEYKAALAEAKVSGPIAPDSECPCMKDKPSPQKLNSHKLRIVPAD